MLQTFQICIFNILLMAYLFSYSVVLYKLFAKKIGFQKKVHYILYVQIRSSQFLNSYHKGKDFNANACLQSVTQNRFSNRRICNKMASISCCIFYNKCNFAYFSYIQHILKFYCIFNFLLEIHQSINITSLQNYIRTYIIWQPFLVL